MVFLPPTWLQGRTKDSCKTKGHDLRQIWRRAQEVRHIGLRSLMHPGLIPQWALRWICCPDCPAASSRILEQKASLRGQSSACCKTVQGKWDHACRRESDAVFALPKFFKKFVSTATIEILWSYLCQWDITTMPYYIGISTNGVFKHDTHHAAIGVGGLEAGSMPGAAAESSGAVTKRWALGFANCGVGPGLPVKCNL